MQLIVTTRFHRDNGSLLLRRIKSLTSDAWLSLLEEYPPDPKPGSAAIFQVLGLYLVVGLVLAMNRYVADDSYGWLPLGWTQDQPPGTERIWWAFVQVLSYIVPPVLYLRFVMCRSVREMGLSTVGISKHLPIYALFAVVVIPLVVVVSGTPHFLSTYPMARDAAMQWKTLVVWEIVYAAQFVGLEFFFRGFMVFGPVRVLGAWVVPVMMVPYMMIHFQKPYLETTGAVIAGLALGMVALKTRSIYAGMVLHITVAWLMEFLALYHTGGWARLAVD